MLGAAARRFAPRPARESVHQARTPNRLFTVQKGRTPRTSRAEAEPRRGDPPPHVAQKVECSARDGDPAFCACPFHSCPPRRAAAPSMWIPDSEIVPGRLVKVLRPSARILSLSAAWSRAPDGFFRERRIQVASPDLARI
jgi:hypothetical protein